MKLYETEGQDPIADVATTDEAIVAACKSGDGNYRAVGPSVGMDITVETEGVTVRLPRRAVRNTPIKHDPVTDALAVVFDVEQMGLGGDEPMDFQVALWDRLPSVIRNLVAYAREAKARETLAKS